MCVLHRKQYSFFPWLAVALVACGGDGTVDGTGGAIDVAPIGGGSSKSIYAPETGTRWHWQLTGTLNTAYDVDVYDLDLFDTEVSVISGLQARGIRVICYFSAGSYENWRPDATDFPATVLGNPLDGWEGERWLDIRSTTVLAIMEARLDLAKDKGCDGVEPDNVDGYTNTPGFPLTAAHQLSFNRFLATAAHDRNLSIGLKNDLEQVDALVDDFDFAVNEQCHEYEECDALAPFVAQNKAVFNAEYRSLWRNDASARAALCQAAVNEGLSTLVLPVELDDSFRLACP